MTEEKPVRWKPTRDSTGRVKAIMVVPHKVDDEGNVLEFRVWGDGSRDESGHGMVWDAETLRIYYKPERDR